MKKVEHIGIAVKDLEAAMRLYSKLLGVDLEKKETVTSESVTIAFFNVGETKIELLEASKPDSPIARFIEKRGEGIHHIAFEVDDIQEAISRMKSEGFEVVNETPIQGADNKLVCFLHPKSTHGVLIELCQEIK